MTHTKTRPGFPLDDAVAASGRAGGADVHELLDLISHFDPDHNAAAHALLWSQILAADIAVPTDGKICPTN